ncbi:MAG TPA: hypothetical protein VF526_15495 [Solirubrobacteraceae bacterium]|jgi:hypothetical protein
MTEYLLMRILFWFAVGFLAGFVLVGFVLLWLRRPLAPLERPAAARP